MPKKTKGWTDERRAAQAARCRAKKPWTHATGPKTETGKSQSAQNAYHHGLYSAEIDRLRILLRHHRTAIKFIHGFYNDE